ncbi:efflux RND transporter periplasmic adaptor subunit [Chitinophaga sancti]|uniref:Efflux RND transporter periplasmic adaptor subunit n=1 Tax=Chitinophaga sancti TaxID=1004 RepID=A0A1K1NR01_9BACT|nr:efflux RND transporter periplasmic adaptor subunit [Chitinophaga sancti]WQD60114.1 efflux RND transporter periplasmic adaptor subunit [Chitinophaga sancti]WQG87758.1 efflux RND transporter periplasmic adaptor subunit [Chitinophaga sancti]SFW37675.1 membrane fusion protein, multidrug efflux system [Chitinophaga sancti]
MAGNKKFLKTVVYLVLAVVIIVIIYSRFAAPKKEAAPNKETVRGGKGNKPLLVDAFIVHTSSLNEVIDASGTLQSNEEVQIQPEITGKITGLFFKEGTQVAKGTLLVKIYDEDLKAQLSKLELQQQLAKTTLERQENLLKINGISRQDVDVTRNQVSAYGADITYTRTQLQKTELRAPFSGRLGLRNISLGAIVNNTTIITTLQQIDPLKVDFTVPEKYRNAVKQGDAVNFKVAGDARPYKGQIYALDPKIDLATRTIKLRAIVPNPGQLLPGAFANVQIALRNMPDALMIPSQAVIPGTRDKKVIIADQGKAKFVVVETGLRDADNVQITNGLSKGDTVITSGMLQLKPGMVLKYNKIN